MHTFCVDLKHLSLDEVVSLAVAAESYKVVDLGAVCRAQIEKLVRPNTVWTTLDRLLAAKAYRAARSCSKVIINNTKIVIERDNN